MAIDSADMALAAQSAASMANTAINYANMTEDKKENETIRAWNEKMYAMQLADSRENWRLQNEYNTPVEQMKRFKDAGLNPNLVYGSSSNNGNAGSVNNVTPVGTVNPYQHPQNIMASMGDLMDQVVKATQVDKLRADTDSVMARTRLTNFDSHLRELQVINQAISNERDIRTKEYLIEAKKRILDQMDAHINNLDATTTGIDIDNFYRGKKNSVAIAEGEQRIKESQQRVTRSISDMALDEYRRGLLKAQITNYISSARLNDARVDQVIADISRIESNAVLSDIEAVIKLDKANNGDGDLMTKLFDILYKRKLHGTYNLSLPNLEKRIKK